jgi:hypothetical protein
MCGHLGLTIIAHLNDRIHVFVAAGRNCLILQPQFQLMLRETTLIMTTPGTCLVPAAPARPGKDMSDR